MSILKNQDLSFVTQELEFKLESTTSGATFSSDGIYRYLLWRRLREGNNFVLFVGLNPSTADESNDDPTIRRCKGFATKWGASGILVANLFAFRATYPKDLYAFEEPVGEMNDTWIRVASRIANRSIACWGNHGVYKERASAVLTCLENPACLHMTKAGQPGHPLYLPSTSQPLPMQ
jgi:hypothetical protein